ncbi:biotin--[acetyl-CoA-carboxylase] ligase [Myxococcota bacterium]|nr:biotin--[acetyl-CoA-carboxylase] ligase [Myxococcota bacterium]
MSNGPARVLSSLRRAGGQVISGQELSSAGGVSRSQVWKDIQALRTRGYEIDASAGEGYRLCSIPDRLYPEEIEAGLETNWLGRNLHYFDETDSTNRVALELAQAGAPAGTVVLAESQTAGRGRLGRRFFSPPYVNLYCSIVLRPELTLDRAPTWILAAAVAVADAIAQHVPDSKTCVELKWPNDVLLGGLKTSGILMELGAEGASVSHLILGIGVNLNVDRTTFPDEFRPNATSLSSHLGQPVNRVDFTQALFLSLEQTLDLCQRSGFDALRGRYEDRFHMRGRTISVHATGATNGGDEIRGTVVGIDMDGALIVKRSDGEETVVMAGDVTLAKGTS